MSVEAPPAVAVAKPPSFVDFMDATIGEHLQPGEPLDYETHGPGLDVMTIDPPERKSVPTNQLAESPKEAAVEVPPTPKMPEDPAPAVSDIPDKPPGVHTPAALKSWADMRKAVETARAEARVAQEKAKEVATLQEQLNQYKDKKAIPVPEWDQIQVERNQMAERLKVTDLEATPEYQVAVTKPQESINEAVKRLSAKYSIEPEKFHAALNETDPDKASDRLSELTDPFNTYDKAFVANKLVPTQEDTNTKRAALRSDAQKTLEIIQAKRQQLADQQEQERKAAWDRGKEKAWTNLEENVWLARKQDGNDAWNQELEKVKEMARTMPQWDRMPEDTRAQILYQAAFLPRTLQTIQVLHQKNRDLELALAKYQGATPGVGGGGAKSPSAPQAPPSGSAQSFVESMMIGTAGR